MKFLGAYSVFHTTKSNSGAPSELNNTVKIKNAKWVKNLCQMIVQFNNNSIALLSSFTQLRILAYQNHQEEYLKLWEEKRNQIAEKWEKIFEIKFNEGEEHEQIVDFEILDSFVLPESFKIRLVIYTNHNQYLVYETETTLNENFKTTSSTNLLFQRYTTDNVHRILGSYNSFENEEKTVLALLSEVDPNKQLKNISE